MATKHKSTKLLKKTKGCVINLLPVLVTNGSRVLDKGVSETTGIKTVFGHLNKYSSLSLL